MQKNLSSTKDKITSLWKKLMKLNQTVSRKLNKFSRMKFKDTNN